MLIVRWLGWWYGRGWSSLVTGLRARLGRIYLEFSVPLLLTTLVAPWHRIVTGKQGSFDQRMKAMVDNTVSRAVGFGVRLMALIAAGLLMAVTALGGIVIAVVWPLVPVSAVVFIVIGLIK